MAEENPAIDSDDVGGVDGGSEHDNDGDFEFGEFEGYEGFGSMGGDENGGYEAMGYGQLIESDGDGDTNDNDGVDNVVSGAVDVASTNGGASSYAGVPPSAAAMMASLPPELAAAAAAAVRSIAMATDDGHEGRVDGGASGGACTVTTAGGVVSHVQLSEGGVHADGDVDDRTGAGAGAGAGAGGGREAQPRTAHGEMNGDAGGVDSEGGASGGDNAGAGTDASVQPHGSGEGDNGDGNDEGAGQVQGEDLERQARQFAMGMRMVDMRLARLDADFTQTHSAAMAAAANRGPSEAELRAALEAEVAAFTAELPHDDEADTGVVNGDGVGESGDGGVGDTSRPRPVSPMPEEHVAQIRADMADFTLNNVPAWVTRMDMDALFGSSSS